MESSQKRIQKSKRRQADPDAVNDQRSDKVLHDGAVASPSAPEGLDQLRQIIADQDDICAFACDICASTHRYSDRRLHKRRCVIDSVAHHDDVVTSCGEGG